MSDNVTDTPTGESTPAKGVPRRTFLARAWQVGLAVIGLAGIWTSIDILRSVGASGLGGVIRTVPEAEVKEIPVYVRSAQTYLTKIDNEIVALWQRCPHLGCRVAWCESSREFECPCHGSKFNRAGELRSGPSPRGMDRFATSVSGDVVEVDTGSVTNGAAPGPETLNEPVAGPSCSEAASE
jgi:Rieske Fe-S protein